MMKIDTAKKETKLRVRYCAALLLALILLMTALLDGCAVLRPVEDSQKKESGKTSEAVCAVGETGELGGVKVKLASVRKDMGNEYIHSEDGKVFIYCEFEIENTSDKEIAVSSLMSFDAYIDDYSVSMSIAAVSALGSPTPDGSVAAGKKMNGVIGYEAEDGWGRLEIRFRPDVLSDEYITFVADDR